MTPAPLVNATQQEVVVKVKRKGVLAALLATVAALGVGVSLAGTASAAGKTVTIGWAYDSKGNMSPFDDPALAAAQQRVKQVNARGGVQLKIITCDTQNNNPAKAKSCALSLLGQGASIIFTTCDVDYATPVVQEAINRGVLAIAPCIGTDQMGPKRFGARAPSHSASATSRRTRARPWRSGPGPRAGRRPAPRPTRCSSTSRRSCRPSRPASSSSAARSSITRRYATGANNVQSAVSRLNAKDADVYVTVDLVRRAPRVRDGHARARQQHADPQLLGRRRHLLGAEGAASRTTTP